MRFIKNAGIASSTILFLFLLKIIASIVGGLVSHYIYKDQTDLYAYTALGLKEYNNLIQHPFIFFNDSLPNAFPNISNEYFGDISFWGYLRNNILVKLIGVLNIFSRGNYYINSLFFNIISFVGNIALYKIFIDIFPKNKWQIIIGCFLLPSTLYFTSLVGKDILISTCLFIFCYCIYFGLQNKFTAKRILFTILSFAIILLIRNFVAIILLPCSLCYIISKRFYLSPTKVFGIMFLGIITIVFLLQFAAPKYNPLQIVVAKQQSFLSLQNANSNYNVDTLQPNIKIFIKAMPAAVRRSFLSPLPLEFTNVFLNVFSVEILFYWGLFIYSIVQYLPVKKIPNPFIVFSIFFTIIIFLFIGYITTNAGSLIRYRSVYLPFLITPILCKINWMKLKKYLGLSITNKSIL